MHACVCVLLGVAAFEGAFCPPYSGSFDMICTDLEMPLMNGLEAIRVIRAMEAKAQSTASPIASSPESRPSVRLELPPPCYMVCISGNVRSEFVDAARDSGADEYVGKPVSKDSLRTVIAAARRKQRAFKEAKINQPTEETKEKIKEETKDQMQQTIQP